jgi:HlyD family secretion protein
VIWVLRNGGPELVRIKTGISDGTSSEVLEGGLAPGDQVITDATGPATRTVSSGGPPRGPRLF